MQLLLEMTTLDADQLIALTLADLKELPVQMDATVAAWRSGDAEQLDELLGKRMRTDLPVLYNVMITQRNHNWAKQILALLETPEVEFVLVGALHLSGPDSVQALLRKAGVKVQRYQLP